MKTILVTGASGLLGVNTIEELIKQEYLVKGFLRKKEKFVGNQSKNLKLIEGDILKIESLINASKNCDCIIHTAAITDQDLLKYEDYYKVNVEGVKNVFDAAIKNKVKRIVYVSTANEFGYGSLGDLGNENKEIKYPFNNLFYAQSKKEAHDFLLTKLNKIDIVTINPTFMIGPYDTKPSSGKIILLGLKNKFVLCPPGGKNFVCVDDVSKGIISAIKNGQNGEAYLLAGQNITFYNFFKLLREMSKNNFRIIKLPNDVMSLIGFVGSLLRKGGIKNNFYKDNMKALSINNYYSNQKATTKLNMVFKPINYGIKDAISWFEGHYLN